MLHSITTAASKSIPKTSATTNKKYCKTWWNNKCSVKHKNKNKAWYKYNKDRGNMTLWIEYKKTEAVFRQTVLAAKKESWTIYLASITDGTTSQEVWKKVKAIKGRTVNHVKPLIKNNEIIAKPQNIANALANISLTYTTLPTLTHFFKHTSQPSNFTQLHLNIAQRITITNPLQFLKLKKHSQTVNQSQQALTPYLLYYFNIFLKINYPIFSHFTIMYGTTASPQSGSTPSSYQF